MRVHQVFVSLGLRHLCVVDSGNKALGMITRKDLDRAAGGGSWRRNPKYAPPPLLALMVPLIQLPGIIPLLTRLSSMDLDRGLMTGW